MRSLLLASTALTLAVGAAQAQQLPSLLSGEATRPSWSVAGVDYSVGVPTGTALQNPTAISMPGVSVNAASQTVTVTGNNVTLSGYNFNNWAVAIAPGANNTTIHNSSFLVGSNNAVPINAATGSGNLTVTNSTLDGNSTTNGAAWALLNYSGSGTLTAKNNAFQNAPEDAIDINSGKMTANVTQNLFTNLGTSPGAHPDTVQFMGTTSNNSVIAYNTVYQPSTSGEQGIQLQAQGGATLSNTAIENNTIVAKGATGQDMSYGIAVIQNSGNSINGATVSGNYIDSSGAWGDFYPPTGSNLDFGGNIDLSTGQTIAAPSGTSSAVPTTTASGGSVQATTPPAIISPAPAANPAPAATAVTTAPVCAGTAPGGGSTLLGSETGDPTNGAGASELSSFTSVMGKPQAMDTYLSIGDPSGFASSAQYSAWTVSSTLGTSAVPVVGIPMAVTSGSADSDFKAIASGAWNSDLTSAFQAYAAAGFKTLIIRPGWEMNGNWYPWSVTPSNAADFVAAFQQIANLAHSFSGMNIQVSWNPGAAASSTSYQSIFPGAQYVDSIGIDTYGLAGGTPDTMPLQTTTDPNSYTLSDAIALAKSTGKPLSLPETGAGPGDTAFPQNLAQVISASGVPVSFAMLWDDSYGGSSNLNWSGNPASDTAWQQAFAAISGNGGGSSCGSTTIIGGGTAYTPTPPGAPTYTGGGGGSSVGPVTTGGLSSAPPATGTPTPPLPAMQTCAATPGGAAAGNFSTQNGNIIAPDGSVFIAKGINVYDAAMGDAEKILADFPGINFIRLAAFSYQSPSAYQSFISTMAAKNVVVEIEHHNAAGGGVPALTGSDLAAENAWFASLASAFKSTPTAWLGTLNEPQDDDPSVAAEQASNYQAIRGTGNNNIIMFSTNTKPPSVATGSMKNVVTDLHFYGWVSNYSTDQTTVNAALSKEVAAAQQLTTANGKMPVIIGETGNSTDGQNLDANWQQVLNADQASGYGNAYWNWYSDAPQDNLTDGSGNLSSPYGTNIKAYIQIVANAAASIWACSGAELASVTQANTNALSAVVAQQAATPAPASSDPPQPAASDTAPASDTPAPAPTPTDTQIANDNASGDAAVAAANKILQGIQAGTNE